MCNACTINIDKSEQFANTLMGYLNSGALTVMISVGHRTRLFDTMSDMSPATSKTIAEEAGLNERYVREWLNAMVVSGIVEYDSDRMEYHLPPEHSAWLTRKSSPNNIAVYAQYIPLSGTVEDKIINCFKNGGGVPYSEYHRFHEVMAEDSGQTVLPALIDNILALVPGLVEDLQNGINVLDIGCGRGEALNLLGAAFPNSNFKGYDISAEAVEYANNKASRNGSSNVQFEVKDASTMNESACYDLITAFDAIHDQALPAKVLSAIEHSLQPDGIFLMQDIAGSSYVQNNVDHPIAPFLYTISTMHCMTVSLAQNGDGLGTMWGEELALEMLAEAGFNKVEVEKLPHDIQNSFYIASKTE